MSRRIFGITAASVAGVAAVAALAVVGARRRRVPTAASLDPLGEAHMWGIVAGSESAEQVPG